MGEGSGERVRPRIVITVISGRAKNLNLGALNPSNPTPRLTYKCVLPSW